MEAYDAITDLKNENHPLTRKKVMRLDRESPVTLHHAQLDQTKFFLTCNHDKVIT
jgi:hypothetical protein